MGVEEVLELDEAWGPDLDVADDREVEVERAALMGPRADSGSAKTREEERVAARKSHEESLAFARPRSLLREDAVDVRLGEEEAAVHPKKFRESLLLEDGCVRVAWPVAQGASRANRRRRPIKLERARS